MYADQAVAAVIIVSATKNPTALPPAASVTRNKMPARIISSVAATADRTRIVPTAPMTLPRLAPLVQVHAGDRAHQSGWEEDEEEEAEDEGDDDEDDGE